MRLLITGASGFLGRHVAEAAVAAGHEVVAAVRHVPEPWRALPAGVELVDGVELTAAGRLHGVVAEAAPDAVIHLAGFAHVGWSHRDPAAAIAVNAAGSAALLSAVAEGAPDARVVLASTSEVYGRSAAPLREGDPLAPESPYGLSKRWMEETAAYFRERHGLSIGVIRSFAHAGAGQGPAFALSNFARQAAEARLRGATAVQITTGNRATVRDLSDVRDAARAYLAMATLRPPDGRAGSSEAEERPVNVGSGRGRTTAEIVGAVAASAALDVDHIEDPALIRPGENPHIVADVSAAGRLLGWTPEIPLEQTAAAAVQWWTTQLERDPAHGADTFG